VWRETVSENGEDYELDLFQSTLSVWRETVKAINSSLEVKAFQSTLSVWRETVALQLVCMSRAISIHSLRVERDLSPIR